MGVRGLRSFFDNNSDLIVQKQLHDTRVIIDGTNLLYYLYQQLADNNQGFKYGGDYNSFAVNCKQFFSTLRRCGIEPIIVFDGGADRSQIKMKTILQRINHRLSNCRRAVKTGTNIGLVLPVLSQMVLKDVLRELAIPFVQSIGEADNDIAMLANYYSAPVISNDSDFFIFDLNSGFIPLDSIDFITPRISKQSNLDEVNCYCYLDCSFYNISVFLDHFPGLDRRMLPIFSSFMGNDYVASSVFEKIFNSLPNDAIKSVKPQRKSLKIGKRHKNMVRLLDWMRNKEVDSSVSFLLTFLKSEHRQLASKLLKFTVNSYDGGNNRSPLLKFLPRKADDDSNKDNNDSLKLLFSLESTLIPEWLIDNFCQSEYDPVFMNIILIKKCILLPQIDDLNLPSSYEPSSDLQNYLYSLLRFDDQPIKLEIYDRKDSNLARRIITLDQTNQLITLESIGPMNEESRKKLLLNLILSNCEEYDNLERQLKADNPGGKIDKSLTMLIITIKYWTKKVDYIYRESLIALLAVIIFHGIVNGKKSLSPNLDFDQRETIKSNFGRFQVHPVINHSRPFNARIVHTFNQLQCIILFLSRIQALIPCSLPLIKSHKFLEGSTIYNLTNDLFKRSDPILYIQQLFGRRCFISQLFNSLVNFIEEDKPLQRFTKKIKRETVDIDFDVDLAF